MTKYEQAEKFLKWVNANYQYLYQHHQAFCKNKTIDFDEDVFAETYLKIYDKIVKDGLDDCSDKGFLNYFFRSFVTNIKRQKQYASVRKKTDNANIPVHHEKYLNKRLTEVEKLKKDLYTDFSTLYLLKKLDENFPPADNRIFKTKLFLNLTYKQLIEKTGEKNVRQRIVDMKNWLKENVSRAEIDKAFNEEYGDLIYE